jgi:lipid-A-disaccharide synthase
MVNLIAGEEVVPELVQHDFTAERVALELKRIIPDGPRRAQMLDGLRRVRTLLRGEADSGLQPAQKAARKILDLYPAKLSANR